MRVRRLLAAICPAAGLFVAVALGLGSAGALAQQSPTGDATVGIRSDDKGQIIHRAPAIAMHGTPKYPPGFRHFDYVNPNAPKGGELRLGDDGTFDSFNPYAVKGNPAPGAVAESLLTSSADEPFTEYGLIAESIEWPDDRSWVAFTLRPEARWHDGQTITVEDVIFSLDILKTKGRPFYRFYYASIVKAEKTGPRTVRFSFSEQNNRELPLIAGQIPILPKHYWEGRDFDRATLEPPLISGPYKIGSFEAGRFVVLERVVDYWGKDLAVNVGQNNFDRIRYDYYLDETVLRQALKAGQIDYRLENQAKAWALDYDVPAVREGWLKKEALPHKRGTGMQAFIMNTRRPPFDNRKLREALNYALDFEWTNRNLFFGLYARTTSFFSNSELASSGLPEGEELTSLERFRDRLPPEVFARPYTVPTTDGTGSPRDNLERAFKLLDEAGYEVRDMRLVNKRTGQPLRFEFLLVSPAFERIVLPFKRNLARLGVEMDVRLVDQSQYINRIRGYDFDMIVSGWGQSSSPGNEQREFWSAAAAKQPGSRNYMGIQDPVIDALIEDVVSAPDRESLVARTRALDRVLLWGHFVIPTWHSRTDRVLFWDRFSKPDVVADRGTEVSYWWYDPAKAAALEARQPVQSTGSGPRGSDMPNVGTIVLIVAGLGLLGWFAWRRTFKTGPSSGGSAG